MRLNRSQPPPPPSFNEASFLTRAGQRTNCRQHLSLETTIASPRTAARPVVWPSAPGWANSVANPSPARKMGNPAVMTTFGQRGH